MKGKALVPYLPKQPGPKGPAIREAFGPLDRISISNRSEDKNARIHYKPHDSSTIGHALERVDEPGNVETFTHEQIAELKRSGRLIYERGYFEQKSAEIRLLAGDLRLVDLHLKRQDRIDFKQIIVEGLDRMIQMGQASKSDESIDRALELIFAVRGAELDRLKGKKRADGNGYHRWIPCAKSVRNWYNTLQSANGAALALIDQYKYGPQPSPLDADIQTVLFWASRKFASNSKPTVADVHRRMKSLINRINRARKKRDLGPFGCPDYNTLEARIAANGAFYNYAGRQGEDNAKSHFALVMGGPTATRLGERWEMDFWLAHIQVWLRYSKLWPYLSPEQKDGLEKSRWNLCVALDCASQAVVGMRMSPTETAEAAIATLEMGMIDKTNYAITAGARSTWRMYCGCEKIATDQGSAFWSTFKAACNKLGIKTDNPPAALAFMRGKIERLFRTIDVQAFARLVGRTFENTVTRGDAPDIAALTLEQLATVLVLYVVDCYHREGHESLAGDTPDHAWDRLERQRGVTPAPDIHTRRNASGLNLTRQLDKNGVRVLNNYYNDRVLSQHLRDANQSLKAGEPFDVDVIADRLNVGWVSVRLGAKGFHNVKCITEEMQGVSMMTVIALCADLRRRFKNGNVPDEEIALDALDQIEAIGEAARLTYNIACPIITLETVERFERHVESPWTSREAARANPDAGGDILARAIKANPPGNYTPPVAPPLVAPAPRTAPQDRINVDPETGEITPSANLDDDEDDADLPDGWSSE